MGRRCQRNRTQQVVDQAFVGAGDPNAGNARGLAVVQDGKLLIQKRATGFPKDMPLLGWSMTKTINMMTFYKKAQETNFDMNQLVINAFPANREPSWVAQWRQDPQKSQIKVTDLMFMKSGLDIEDDYGPQGQGRPDVVRRAEHGRVRCVPAHGSRARHVLGIQHWQLRHHQPDRPRDVPDDQAYWQYWQKSVFEPIGSTAERSPQTPSGPGSVAPTSGANTGDWAKLGQLMLNDGAWNSQQVIPKGWWKLAGTPAMPDGEGHGYGAQTWIPGQPVGGECNSDPGVPADTLSMEATMGSSSRWFPQRRP